jgi:hypothetical protein
VNEKRFDIGLQISRIEANRSVRDAIIAKLRNQRSPEHISVTDLLSPKQAYFKRKHPEIAPELGKQQVMWQGTGFHRVFETLVSSEEYIEQFVELEDIVGKIDIYEDYPIDVKTTSNLGENVDLLRKRPGYVEQLGIYCAMVDEKKGKIVIYQREMPENSKLPLTTYHIRFSDPEAIRDEIFKRSARLREALATGNPSFLPRCPWCSSNCEYSSVCGWENTSVPAWNQITKLVEEVHPDPDTTQKILLKLRQPSPGRVFRLNDIVLPRKAYFARLKGEGSADEEVDSEEAKERLTSIDRQGFLQLVTDALKYSASGKTKRIGVSLNALRDRVLLDNGLPTIVRANGLRSVVERDRLPEFFFHYLLRLGFECALSGIPRGRLVLYYRNVPSEDGKLLVYDISFRSLESLKAEVMSRIDLLGKAGGPAELPSCPSWMCRFCEYATACSGS